MEGHFQGEIEEKFFSPKMCVHTLGGEGGGSGRCGKNPHFLFFFLKASLIEMDIELDNFLHWWNKYKVSSATIVTCAVAQSDYWHFQMDW